MANRDLGTAILNIRIQFEKINTKALGRSLGKLIKELEKSLGSPEVATSAMKAGVKLGKKIVDSIAESLNKNKGKLTSALSSPLGGDLGGLRKNLDQIKLKQDELRQASRLLKAEMAKPAGDQNPLRIEQLKQIRVNLLEEINLLRLRNKLDKDFKISSASKSRATEIEKSNRALERGSGELIKTVGVLKEIQRNFAKSSKTSAAFAAAVGSAKQATDKLLLNLVKTESKTKGQKQVIESLDSTYKRLVDRVKTQVRNQKLQVEIINNLRRGYAAAVNESKKLTLDKSLAALNKGIGAKNNITDLRTIVQLLTRVQKGYNDLGITINGVEGAVGRARKKIAQLNNIKLKNLRQVFHTITSGVNQFGEQLRRVSFILRDVGRQLMTAGKAGFRYLMPLVEDFSKYEQAVTDVLATTGDLNNDLTKTDVLTTSLSKTILDLAGNFMFSAEEIAGVAKQLALAGFSTQQIETGLSSVLQLASATGSDLTTATNIAISAMSTFGLEAENLGRVVDVFAATVTRSNTNLNQLSEGFKIVAPVAAQMGQSIEETAAGLGILANAGLKGTVAGTGLARILTQLVEKSGTLDASLSSLGSGFDNLDPQRNNLSDIIAEFERLNLSASTLLEVFDLRAFRALNAMLAQTSDGLGNLVEQLERAEGVAEAISGARLQTLAANMQLLSDAATSLRISLGSLVAKEANDFLVFLRETVVGLREFVELNREQLAPVLKFLFTLSGALTTFGASVFTTGAAASFLAAPLILLGSVLAGLTVMVGSAASLAVSLGATFTAVAIPIAAVAAVITSVVSGLGALFASTFLAITVSISNFTDKWGEFFAQVTETASELFNSIFPRIVEGFTKSLPAIEAATDSLIKALGSVFDPNQINLLDWESFGEILGNLIALFIEFAAAVVRDWTPTVQRLIMVFESLVFQLTTLSTATESLNLNKIERLAEVMAFLFDPLNLIPGYLILKMIFSTWDSIYSWMFKVSEKQKDLNNDIKAMFDSQANSMGALLGRTKEFASELKKIEPILSKLSSAKPLEFSRIKDAAQKGILNPLTRDADLKELREKRKELKDLAAKAGDDPVRFEIEARIREIEKTYEDITRVGKQFDKIRGLIEDKSPEQIEAEFKKLLSGESERKKAIEALQSDILKVRSQILSGGKLGEAQIGEFKRRIKDLTGVAIEIDMTNPAQSLEAALRGSIQKALEDTQNNLTLIKDLGKIIPDLQNLDLTDPKSWEKISSAFFEISQNADEVSKNLAQAQQDQLTIQKEIDKLGMNAFQRRKEELRMEAEARKVRLKEIRETLKAEQAMLQNQLRTSELEGKPTDAIKASIQANQENLKANAELGNQLGFGRFVNGEFQFDENDDLIDNKLKTNEELANMDMEARKQAELEIAEARLEVEEDTAERIRLKQQLIDAKRDKELADRLDNLRQNMDPTANMEERIRLEKELTDAVNAAREKEKLDVVAQENEKAQKDQEDALDKNKQQAEKRVDLENELLNNLGKQVTSLQQMAMLMQFIEVIQRRKDQAALRALRELSKEEQKLVRMRLRGGGDDKAMAAIKAQEDLVAFMRGKVARNIGQAGAQGGDPRGIFNIQAFLARLNQAMTNFVDGLKANPLIIPAKFDKEMLVKSLKDAVKGFRIEDMAGMLGGGIGINSHTVGANFGTINHNDNRVINVNVNRLTADVARPLGMMNS